MNFSLILIGVIFLAAFILPVVYIHRVQKNKGKNFLKHYMTLAEKNQVKIVENDMWDSSNCIGIDTVSKKILVLKKNDEGEESILIDLKEVDKCFASPTYRSFKGNKNNKILERLDLVFTYKNSSKPENQINFFINSGNSTLSDQQVLAEKWCGIVNKHLQHI